MQTARRAPREGNESGNGRPPQVTVIDSRFTVSGVAGSRSTVDIISFSESADAVGHASPIATELPEKISENDWPTTARMPWRRIACGACSRDEPQPKFALTSMICAALYAGFDRGWFGACSRSSSNR